MSSAYSGADPVAAYSKNRIGQVSKTVFDTEDFHEANRVVNPSSDELRGGAKNWSNVWKTATEPNGYNVTENSKHQKKMASGPQSSDVSVNPFTYNT